MQPVLNAFVDDGGKDLVIIEQTPDGFRQRRERAEYITYYRSSAVDDNLMRSLKHSAMVQSVTRETENWIRVGWVDEFSRRKARWPFKNQGIETYEGDVNPVRYWLTKTRATIAKPRRCYLDIEADSRVPFSKKEEMRILCWAVSDDTGPIAKAVLREDTNEAEAEILEKLWNVLENYDQVCAWYGGHPDDKDKGFDFYVIAQRSARAGLPVDTRRWLWLDQLVVWRRMNQAESGDEKESMRLEDIAQNQVGEGKEKTPDWVVEQFGEKSLGAITWELWAAGGKFRKLLVDYCVKDTELLRKLEKRKGFITLFQSVCELTGVFGDTFGLFPSGQADGFLMRIGRDHDHRFATKKFEKEDNKINFEGAFVLAPRTVESPETERDPGWSKEQAAKWRKEHDMEDGILRDVHVCDFASLYPSNIITWNLSEDVLVEEEQILKLVLEAFRDGKPIPEGYCISPGTRVVTRVSPHGILTIALRQLLQLRKQYQDEAKKYPPGTPLYVDWMAKSNACKVVANSFYGVMGQKAGRYFNKNVARSTTQNGVWLIKSVMAEGEKRGIEVIAGDTDSAFVIGSSRDSFAKFVDWLNAKHLPKIISATGAKDNRVKLEFEKSFDILVFSGKKRYAGRYAHYKWKTTCNQCFKKDKETGKPTKTPGAVDVRTLRCDDCGYQYDKPPPFIGKPEIKGLEYRRGDWSRLAREMQGQVIDLLVGGLNLNPGLENVERPIMDMRRYEAVITKWRDRVMNGPLKREEVRIAKSLKEMKDYDTGKDDKKTVPAHVQIAKVLEARGQSITPGTKIEYVVVDSEAKPMRVIPAEDFTGECDRYHLWDTLVYPPTQRLLEGAFPDVDWAKFADVRIKSPKKKSKVSDNQVGFVFDAPKPVSNRFDTEELAIPGYKVEPLKIHISEEMAKAGGMERVEAILRQNPGARPVEIVVVLDSGAEALLKSKLRVSTGPKLKKQVEEILEIAS